MSNESLNKLFWEAEIRLMFFRVQDSPKIFK